MISLGLFVRLEAKPGKEREVAAFLKQGLQMANQEATTPVWFALRLGPTTFGVFDAFHDEAGTANPPQRADCPGAYGQRSDLLAVSRRSIEQIDVLGAKLPG